MSEIRTKVIDIIADRLSKDKAGITDASDLVADLGADSLDVAEITMDLEDAFGVKIEEEKGKQLLMVGGAASLSTLVSGLNALGVTPRDMISILQTIKAAGALQAAIDVL